MWEPETIPGTSAERVGEDSAPLEDEVHSLLTEAIDREMEEGILSAIPGKNQLEIRARALIAELAPLMPAQRQHEIARAVVARIIGLGPLQPLLDDPTVTEIMVNKPDEIYIERSGQIERAHLSFRDGSQLRHIIERIVAPLGRRIDESSPLVDARLPDGSRVNAIIPPLAIGSPSLTIRKFAREPFTLETLTHIGTLSDEMAAFLARSVRERRSLVISGGTGSGKTTTLNALGLCIPEGERVITIEDAAELQLRHPHLVSLEARPPNIEGKGEIPIRILVRNALRMRPDRIIVGEVRGGEAFDMLQAMNTGHKGSMTTLHANSAEDAFVRLESMVLMAGFELPLRAIQGMIQGAVDLILQQDRLRDGSRVVTSISWVNKARSDRLSLHPIFTFDADTGLHRRA